MVVGASCSTPGHPVLSPYSNAPSYRGFFAYLHICGALHMWRYAEIPSMRRQRRARQTALKTCRASWRRAGGADALRDTEV